MSNLLFSFQSLLYKNFLETDLGVLYQSIPFEAFAEAISKPASAKSNLGCKPWFDVKVENPRKLTPFRQTKLTPFGHFKYIFHVVENPVSKFTKMNIICNQSNLIKGEY